MFEFSINKSILKICVVHLDAHYLNPLLVFTSHSPLFIRLSGVNDIHLLLLQQMNEMNKNHEQGCAEISALASLGL